MIRLEGKIPKLLILLLLCLICGGILTLIASLLIEPIFNRPLLGVYSDMNNPENISIVKFVQLFSSVGLFVIPGILFSLFFISKPLEKMGIKRSVSVLNLGLIILLFISLVPLINWMVELNDQLILPDAFSEIEAWMRSAEDRAKELTTVFLQMNTKLDLFYNILLIGIIPAVGEELIFRGLVQRIINKNLNNYHIGIWVSAFLFSAMHLQFFGFLPRMILGAFFGYLFVWSGSLWLPMFAHFLNNTAAVVAVYFLGADAIENEFDKVGTTEGTYLITVLSLLVFSGLMFYYRKKNTAELQVS